MFGLDPDEFAYRRFVVVDGRRGAVMAGDHSGKHVGDTVARRRPDVHRSRASTTPATASRISASCCRCDTVEALAKRPGEITSIGVT